MVLAVASGKGGTGKTTVAVNLARVFGSPIQVLDCDVEEPNAHLFIRGTRIDSDIVTIPVPYVGESRCDGCGACARFCEYHAIVTYGTAPIIFPELCHGCGGCANICPRRAIFEKGKRVGFIETTRLDGITLIQGRMDVGCAMAPPIIRAVKARRDHTIPAILDAPPGTSCPVIASLRDADYVLLVTEPTPFGLHDLTLAVETVRVLGIPFGVVINRAGVGDRRVHQFCAVEGIPILQEIPDDRRIAEAYSRGLLIVDALPEYRDLFVELLAQTRDRILTGVPQ